MARRLPFRVLGAGLAFLALAGLSAPSDPPRELKDATVAAAGQSLVVGSIRFLRNGAEKKCSVAGVKCLLVILPPGTHRAMSYQFERSTPFTWSLPPGDYIALAFQRTDRGSTVMPFRALFTVPEGGGPIYIGDLLFAVQGARAVVGAGDDFVEAGKRFDAAHPDLAGKLAKNLVRQEDVLGDASEVVGICDEAWKLACTKNQLGVTPASPSDGRGYDRITDLRPEFRWNSSADPQVTYDFALYDSASFGLDALSKSHVEGRVVAYRQGLAEPAWRPDTPLEADHRYYWSVRLRRGQTVSTWSTWSYFNFFIIGFASGYGQWFRFMTPETVPAP